MLFYFKGKGHKVKQCFKRKIIIKFNYYQVKQCFFKHGHQIINKHNLSGLYIITPLQRSKQGTPSYMPPNPCSSFTLTEPDLYSLLGIKLLQDSFQDFKTYSNQVHHLDFPSNVGTQQEQYIKYMAFFFFAISQPRKLSEPFLLERGRCFFQHKIT